jgi:cellobiose-specific phosphotransferase system component IIA
MSNELTDEQVLKANQAILSAHKQMTELIKQINEVCDNFVKTKSEFNHNERLLITNRALSFITQSRAHNYFLSIDDLSVRAFNKFQSDDKP